MFSVMCGLSVLCLWLSVVHIFMLFLFFTADIYTFIYLPYSKGIFHIGGLVSKMHISIYVLFTEWKCFCFLFLFAFIEYNLGIMNIQCIL